MQGFVEHLKKKVSASPKRSILFPEFADERIQKAVAILNTEGILDAQILAGQTDEPLTEAMEQLANGTVDGVVAGATHTTADVVRSALKIVGKAKGIQTVSSSFYMVVPSFRNSKNEEVLTFADCAVVPEPTVEQLRDIALASADARASIVGDEPRIALLSYSTHGSGGSRASVDLVREATALVKQERSNLNVVGEVQADAALIPEVAKGKSADLKGDANVLIFPSLDAGNIAYKLVAHITPGAHAIGPVLQGLKKPVSDLSRGATVDDIVLTAIITAAQVSKK